MDWARQPGAWLLLGTMLCLAWLGATTEVLDEPQHQPSTDRAIATIGASVRAGDAVIVKPMWDDGLHQRLSDALEQAGLSRTGLVSGERVDPADLLRHERAWVLSRFGAGSALPGLDAADRHPVESTDLGAGVHLALYELPDARHAGRLTDDTASLTVARHLASGRVQRCQWRDSRHRCGAKSWLDVRRETR
ncbi:MAG: hypothetical protein QF464_21225, partial [Myxococcota bacterium]|nr:hypothetical protein [Myxococcota bacterium]